MSLFNVMNRTSPHMSKRENRCEYLIIHCITYSPDGFADYASKRTGTGFHSERDVIDFMDDSKLWMENKGHTQGVKVSANKVILRDGSVVEYAPDTQKTWHAGWGKLSGSGKINFNNISCGYELTRDASKPVGEQYSQAQIESLMYWCKRGGWHPDQIKTHAQISGWRGKSDPDFFDFTTFVDQYRSYYQLEI